MIPFSFIGIQPLSTGVVRVNFNNTTWIQSGDVWTYVIPRVTHKSGLYPRTLVADASNHMLTGVGIEYSIGGDVKLVAINPITNFVVYFYGDNTEQPPQTSETFMFQDSTDGVYVRVGEDWYYNTGSAQTWNKQVSGFAPLGQYKQMTSRQGIAAIVAMDGGVYIKLSNQQTFGSVENIPTSAKKICIPDTRPQSFPYQFYVLCENGDVYGKNGSTWNQIQFPERMIEMAMNGSSLLFKSATNKVYATGYNYHAEFPFYDVDPVSSFYILKKTSAAGNYLYVSEIGQCGIVCLFKFLDDDTWYRTGLLLTNYSYVSDFDGFSLNSNREVPYTYEISSGYGVDILRGGNNEVFMMKMYGSWQQFKLPDLYDGACGSGTASQITYMSLADHSGIHKFADSTVPNYTVLPFPV